MISVLHILNEVRSSGAEIMIKTAHPYWQESGAVLHALGTGKVLGSYAGNLSDQGIIVHHLPFVNSLKFYSQMIRLLRAHQFDVVHIHTERAALTYACLARISGTPRIIRTIHNSFLFEGLLRVVLTVRRWAVRQLGVAQVSVSDSVKQNEQTRFGNSTRLIYNWFDDPHFRPPSMQERSENRKRLGLSNRQKVIVSVGNCATVKNHGAVIQALALIKKNELFPLYWHIGEEDSEHKEANLVRELDLDAQVRFWGRQEDVRPFLWAADIFVMPSFYEGFSLAMLEALASGIQLVLTRSPGLKEWATLIPEIIYTETSAADLARGLLQALKTPKNHEQAEQRSATIKTLFSVERGAQEYLILYNHMLTKNVN